MIEKQTRKTKRGGVREGAGRPKGSTNKISPQEFLQDFQAASGQTLSKFIVNKIIEADINGERELVSKYVLGMGRYVMQDVKEVDITSQGQPILTQLIFDQVEIDDWKDSPPSTH